MRFPLIWIGLKRRKPPEPIVETDEMRAVREWETHMDSRLVFGLMNDTRYFSSRAAEEARRGPKAVLRNSMNQHIDTVTIEPVYSSVTGELVATGE
jgi:hypothetical protein